MYIPPNAYRSTNYIKVLVSYCYLKHVKVGGGNITDVQLFSVPESFQDPVNNNIYCLHREQMIPIFDALLVNITWARILINTYWRRKNV